MPDNFYILTDDTFLAIHQNLELAHEEIIRAGDPDPQLCNNCRIVPAEHACVLVDSALAILNLIRPVAQDSQETDVLQTPQE